MKIKDFTVGQVVYAFSYEDIALLKGLKPKKYTVAKIGRKYLYAARGEEVNIKTVPDYLLIGFKEPDYTDDFLEENIDYGYKAILFPDMESTQLQEINLMENPIASWRLTLKLSIYQKREASKMDKANTGEQPARLYRNKETGELLTYREMLEEWRERYEGIDPVTGLYQYHWHTRYEYIPK